MKNKFFIIAAAALCMAFSAAPSFAASKDYVGGASGDWFDDAGWVGGHPINTGDIAYVNGPVTPDISITTAGAVVGAMYVSLGAAINVSGSGTLMTNFLEMSTFLGASYLNISAGGTVTSSLTYINTNSNSAGVTITGAGSKFENGFLIIGRLGGFGTNYKASITVADGGELSVNGGTGIVFIGSGANNNYVGELNIGTGAAHGIVSASLITTANDASSINLNFTDSYTLGASIVGPGSLTMNGLGGIATLSGANTYAGGTTIFGGTVSATTSSSVGSGPVILNGGTFQAGVGGLNISNAFSIGPSLGTIDTNGNNLQLNGVISGIGNWQKNGAGELTLNNSNTISGVLTINDGSVKINNEAGFGTGDVVLRGGSKLTFGETNINVQNNVELSTIGGSAHELDTQANIVFLSGIVSGDAVLQKTGSGILVLNRANTYTGGTSIYDGTIVLANASALGTGLVVLNDGATLKAGINDMMIANDIFTGCSCSPAVIDTQSFNVSLSGAIFGSGYLQKDGSGTLIYNGDGSLFGGNITIANGTLMVGDATHPAVVLGDGSSIGLVSQGATLSGHGTFGGNVSNDGTVSPGGSIGTLTITGNYTQTSMGYLAVSVSPSASSLLAVQGVASVSGTLHLTLEPGAYAPKTYTFLTGVGGVNGQFTNVVIGQTTDGGVIILQSLSPDYNYAANSVSFSLGAFTISATPSNSTSFMGLTSTAIQSSIRVGNIIFDQLAGDTNSANDQTAALAFASIGDSQMVNAENATGINDLARALPNIMKEKGGWFKAYGNLGSVDSTSVNAGYSSQAGGFLFGVDQAISKTLRIGAAGGYEHTDVDGFTATKSNGAADTMRFALYGRQMVFDDIALDGQAGYALHMFDNERFVAATGTDATSDHDGHEFSGTLQGSKNFHASGFKLTPRAGVHYTHLYEEDFSETGAGAFNATFAEHDTDSVQLFTGFTAVAPTQDVEGYRVTPEAHIKYSYEVLDTSRKANGTVGAATFSATGISAAKNTLSLGTSARVKLDDIVDGFVSYDVNLPTSTNFDQTFALGVKVRF